MTRELHLTSFHVVEICTDSPKGRGKRQIRAFILSSGKTSREGTALLILEKRLHRSGAGGRLSYLQDRV
jgi:hypothetical protein